MGQINDWIISIAVVSIAAGVITCIIPKSKLKKTYCILISVLMLYTVMLPIIRNNKIKFDIDAVFDIDGEVSLNLNEKNESVMIASAQTGIENAIVRLFSENSIQYEKIDVKCKIENEGIKNQSVSVSGNREADEEAIVNIIRQCVGNEATIKFVKGDSDG